MTAAPNEKLFEDEVRWERMFPDQLERRFAACPVHLDLKTLVELVQPSVGARLCALADFEADSAGFDGRGEPQGDHAGRIETSQLWALEPTAVDVSRMPPRGAPGTFFAMGPDAHAANRLAGQEMVARQVAWLGKKATELISAYDAVGPTVRLRTFADVETLWRDVVAPALPDFLSMQLDPKKTGESVSQGSRWALNWKAAESWRR